MDNKFKYIDVKIDCVSHGYNEKQDEIYTDNLEKYIEDFISHIEKNEEVKANNFYYGECFNLSSFWRGDDWSEVLICKVNNSEEKEDFYKKMLSCFDKNGFVCFVVDFSGIAFEFRLRVNEHIYTKVKLTDVDTNETKTMSRIINNYWNFKDMIEDIVTKDNYTLDYIEYDKTFRDISSIYETTNDDWPFENDIIEFAYNAFNAYLKKDCIYFIICFMDNEMKFKYVNVEMKKETNLH